MGADLTGMQLIIKFNKGFGFLLCVVNIFSKYAWILPLKDKKGSEFYNISMKSWLQDNNIKMYSAHNEGKSVVAERLIRTLKTKIYRYMTSISKNVYIDKLGDIVNKYINTYHRTSKVKPVDVKDNAYINFGKESNDKDHKFQVDATISK